MNMKWFYIGLVGLLIVYAGFVAGCGQTSSDSTTTTAASGATTTTTTTTPTTTTTLALSIASSAFSNNVAIPTIHASNEISGGTNTSIPLSWNVPSGTVKFALSMRDINASNFVHWQVQNIPSTTTSLAAGASTSGMPSGSTQLWNDFVFSGYGGPAPPAGETHNYKIVIFALSSAADEMMGQISYANFLSNMSGKIIASAEVTGTFLGP